MKNHPCQDKCPNYKDEQCSVCLIQIKEELDPLIHDEQKFLKRAFESIEEIS